MPLIKSGSKKAFKTNVREMINSGYPQKQALAASYSNQRKYKATGGAVAAALSTARKYARKAEGGADLEDPRMKAIGIRPVEGTPNAPEQPVQAPPEQGSWGPPVTAPTPQPAMSEDDLTKAYLKQLSGTETPASPGKVVSGMAQGLADWIKSPGEMMKGPEQVQHVTPGMETEEESFLQNLNNQNYDRQMTDFGAGTAVGMIGGSKFFGTPENAVGIGGGKLTQPKPFTHLKTDSHGQPVVIDKPTWPTFSDTWTDPSKTATFSPLSQTMPEKLNGIPLQSWKPPHDWTEHFDQNPVHVDEPAFQPDKNKKSASGVVILEPDGRVWLTAPTNQFGGYNASFPKGKMEGGLSMAENAVKEAYEETGLKVKIQGHLVDVDKDTSRTRYYIATRESGTPMDMGWESQGVHVANIHDVGKYLNKPADMQVIDALKNWAKEKGQPAKPSVEPQPATKNAPDANGKYFGKYFHPYDLDPAEVKQFKFIKGNHETGGSNPGGVYHAPDGTPVYIKQFEGDYAIERTYNEKLANELLKLAGVPVANVRMTQLKGHPAIASDMVPGKELNTVSPTKYASLKDLRSHYPAHLWTGNYDFVGTGKNNIMVMPDGQTIHIDPGGALRYRAQGKLKGPDMWGPNVEHFKMTPGKDLTDVMGEHYNNTQMMGPSAKRVAAITDQQIHDLVQQYGPLQKGEKAKLEETLKARRDGVAKLFEDKGSTSASPTPSPKQSQTMSQIVTKDKAVSGSPKLSSMTPVEQAQFLSDKASAKFLLKTYGDNVHGIAKELWDIAHEIGPKAADNIVKHLPEEMYSDLDTHLDVVSFQHGENPWKPKPKQEHDLYAMDDDIEPPEGPEGWGHANEDHYGDIKFKPGPHFWDNAPVHDEILHGKASSAVIGKLFDRAANGEPSPFRKIDLATWQPPYAHQIERPKFQNITPEQAKALGVSTEMLLAKGVKSPSKVDHPEFITDPKTKNTGYLEEHALYFFPKDKFHPTDSYGNYEAKPYVMAGKNVWEGYYPRLRGKAGQPSGGVSYSDPIFKNIIKAAHERKIDALILHGVSDLGAGNQTQILVLNVHGTLRATNAQFKNMKSNKPMDAILAAGSIPVFYEAMKKMGGGDNKDEKMARGGKVKFKPFSSTEILTGLDEGYRHKPYGRSAAGKKAVRTAKHYARGGATDPEPKDHEFINFAKGGMIDSNIPGRTDKIPMKVATGAYVLPADIPSALGQGNTIAGKTILDKMFNSGPYGLPLAKGRSQKFQMPRLPHLKGFSQFAEGGETDHTPIIAAGGEYILNPDTVRDIGNGDIGKGHATLDAFVLHTRREHIKTLRKLKPPK